MLNKYKKESLIKDLQFIEKQCGTFIRVIDDMDTEDLPRIDKVLEIYSELTSKILARQKKKGKKFLSDAEIDDLINNTLKESNITKFKDYK